MKHRVGCTWLIWMCLGGCQIEPSTGELGATQLALEPNGYYDSVDVGSAQHLRASLHGIIDDHKRASYSGTWTILEAADANIGNMKYVRDIYQNATFKKVSSSRPYNREHVWPKSIGFPVGDEYNLPFTDCHHLFLSSPSYNSARNNKPFDSCDNNCAEFPVVDSSDANFTDGSHTSGRWETWAGRRGDVARALFYMDVRYEGGNNGNTGKWEPDLRLTDDESMWVKSVTSKNEKIAYMGSLTTLLSWHLEDPVDDIERQHNDVVYGYQENRNPFVDHPEWVACVFENQCDDL